MNLLVVPLLLSLGLAAADKPTPKLPLGKDTTYITEPLDKDGYLDYSAALNDRLGKGITPEKNANVLLWDAIGPWRPESGVRMPAEYWKRLGIQEPPEKGDYFVELGAYLRVKIKLDKMPKELQLDFLQPSLDQQDQAVNRPWSAKDYPFIADWLKVNDKSLAVVIEASKRPDYFNPLIFSPRQCGWLGARVPNVYEYRGLARALAARAMLRVGEGKFDDAWQDLLSCHRLGRLIGRGGCFMDCLRAVAIDQIAINGELAYIERAGLTAKQVQDRIHDLDRLPPMATLLDTIDICERFTFLDTAQLFRCAGIPGVEQLSGEPARWSMPRAIKEEDIAGQEKIMAKLDWEPLLRTGNQWYDRMAAALRIKDRAERKKELDKIEVDLQTLKDSLPESWLVVKLMLEKPDKEVSKKLGDILINMLSHGVPKSQNSCDRSEQAYRNLRIAFALAAYHADNNRYPAKLDDLAPKYLPEVPDDLFSGKALIYRVTEKGYLFYSVGVNGKDEEGRSSDDDPAGDDLPVRMPLPERKPKK